jgi:hypothetical protein
MHNPSAPSDRFAPRVQRAMRVSPSRSSTAGATLITRKFCFCICHVETRSIAVHGITLAATRTSRSPCGEIVSTGPRIANSRHSAIRRNRPKTARPIQPTVSARSPNRTPSITPMIIRMLAATKPAEPSTSRIAFQIDWLKA